MMIEKEKTTFSKSFKKVLRGLDVFRRVVLNIVFFTILYLVLAFLFHDTRPAVPDSTVLVLNPKGAIVEELSLAGLADPIKDSMGLGEGQETLLKDLLDAIESGKNDKRVKVLLLDLNYMGSSGLPKLQDIGAAIDSFKKSGKKVIAMADAYNRDTYYLASRANEIYLHHMGMVTLEGYSRFARFFKEGLDKLGVEVNIFRVGKFKSAVEPYLRDDMSPEAKEANLRYLSVLWELYLKDVAASRKIKAETINDYTDRFNVHLKETKGVASMIALKTGLIDKAVSRDDVSKLLVKIVGEDKKTHSYHKIDFKDYLEALDRDRWGKKESKNLVGVVVARGSILDGNQKPGNIGGDSTAKLIHQARMDKNVKAILLRVDSPGGSAFGSEIIRRELELARKDGKPVVVSMGSVAASGGYWISMASDEVWAYPSTITGSIGIFGIFPTIQKPLANYLGVHVDGVATNKMAEAFRIDRQISPEIAESIQAIINGGYDQFVNLVGTSRHKTYEQVNEIAQGRVWIGADALKLGLVDRLGGLTDALNSAARLAKLGNKYKVKYFRQDINFSQKLISNMFKGAFDDGSKTERAKQSQNPVNETVRILLEQYKQLSAFNDPNGIYAYCMEAGYY